MLDNHIHVMGHGEHRYTAEWISEYLTRAVKLGITDLGFTDHDWFYSDIDIDLARLVQQRLFPNILLGVGMEFDYMPAREQEIAAMIKARDFDYVIGSIHHIGDWNFDHIDHKYGFAERDIDDIYAQYYMLIKNMIASSLFDVVGHIDLVKIWGHRPVRHGQAYYIKSVINDLRKADMVVEINSAGLRKPVKEMYPSRTVLEELFRSGVAVTFGSDAHHPDDVGAGWADAVAMAREVGFRKMICFKGRNKVLVPL